MPLIAQAGYYGLGLLGGVTIALGWITYNDARRGR